MGKVYLVKDLEWQECGMRGTPVTEYRVETVFGSMGVEQNEQSKKWWYKWCFDEYYDEGTSDKAYKTPGAAKKAAFEFYLDRLEGALEDVSEYYSKDED